MLVKVANKDTESVVSALIKQSQRLPSELYRSLTWDRGKELADHQRLTLATEVEVYFCDPRSPWQRGSNENTNRLLRQYLPRGTDLSLHSQAKLSAIARQLNERPRKTLLYSDSSSGAIRSDKMDPSGTRDNASSGSGNASATTAGGATGAPAGAGSSNAVKSDTTGSSKGPAPR